MATLWCMMPLPLMLRISFTVTPAFLSASARRCCRAGLQGIEDHAKGDATSFRPYQCLRQRGLVEGVHREIQRTGRMVYPANCFIADALACYGRGGKERDNRERGFCLLGWCRFNSGSRAGAETKRNEQDSGRKEAIQQD